MPMKLHKRIMCLDIGLGHTGVAIWDKPSRKFIFADCIVTEKQTGSSAESSIARCRFLVKWLRKIARAYKVTNVIAEVPHGGAQSSTAMRAMAQSTACLAAFVELEEVSFTALTPLDLKRVVSPDGHPVGKPEMIQWAKNIFGVKYFKGKKSAHEHIADAMICLVAYQGMPE